MSDAPTLGHADALHNLQMVRAHCASLPSIVPTVECRRRRVTVLDAATSGIGVFGAVYEMLESDQREKVCGIEIERIGITMNRAQLATLATEIEQSRPTPEWDSVGELKRFRTQIEFKGGEKKTLKFNDLVLLHKTLKAEVEYREIKLRAIREALETAMLLADEKQVECEGYPVNYITKKGSRKIVAEKLLANGVSADVIAKSTEISADSCYVMIGKPKRD